VWLRRFSSATESMRDSFFRLLAPAEFLSQTVAIFISFSQIIHNLSDLFADLRESLLISSVSISDFSLIVDQMIKVFRIFLKVCPKVFRVREFVKAVFV
jgi:hypothetical protein